jgi:hypothetical protein
VQHVCGERHVKFVTIISNALECAHDNGHWISTGFSLGVFVLQDDLARPRPNGQGVVFADIATPVVSVPHVRLVKGLIYMSGVSSRRADDSWMGAVARADGMDGPNPVCAGFFLSVFFNVVIWVCLLRWNPDLFSLLSALYEIFPFFVF